MVTKTFRHGIAGGFCPNLYHMLLLSKKLCLGPLGHKGRDIFALNVSKPFFFVLLQDFPGTR